MQAQTKVKLTSGIVYDKAIVADSTGPNSAGSPFDAEGFEDWIGEYETAGVTWMTWTVATDHRASIETTVRLIASARRYVLARPDRFCLVDRADDILVAKKEKRLGITFAFQGTNPLLQDLNMVEAYRRLGVGMMLLAYNSANSTADGCHEPRNAGLSEFGFELIKEMNRTGVIVDVTHTGHRASIQACEVSTRPVVFSHSNPRALYDHDRNITDDQMVLCAQTGGVVGVVGSGLFMSEDPMNVTAEQVFRHVDYIAQLVGAKHVGFGLDYVKNINALKHFHSRTNPGVYPSSQGYNQSRRFAPPSVIAGVAEQMLRRGYSDSETLGVLGENWLRVCRDVWS